MRQTDMAEHLLELRRNLQEILEFQAFIAEVRWHSYCEHIKAGFTPEQALILCQRMKM